jgi:hypothetical protein
MTNKGLIKVMASNNYNIIILGNEEYKTRDCGLPRGIMGFKVFEIVFILK